MAHEIERDTDTLLYVLCSVQRGRKNAHKLYGATFTTTTTTIEALYEKVTHHAPRSRHSSSVEMECCEIV
eukprot:scaffold40080_cov56-Phaeocystis_antarctica.AAC.3